MSNTLERNIVIWKEKATPYFEDRYKKTTFAEKMLAMYLLHAIMEIERLQTDIKDDNIDLNRMLDRGGYYNGNV